MTTYNNETIGELKHWFSVLKDDINLKWNFYFAAPWFTKKAKIFYEEFQEYMKQFPNIKVYYPKDYQENPIKSFERNIEEIKKANAILAWVDEKDCGTSWEIGYAYALNKPIYLLGFNEATFLKSKTNLMLAKSGKALTLFTLKDLFNNCINIHFVELSNNWENIE